VSGVPVSIDWQKSTRCASGTCVEVAEADGVILVRDGKRPEQSPLAFSRAEWTEFLDGIVAGEMGPDGQE
jgi:hypothetical protein